MARGKGGRSAAQAKPRTTRGGGTAVPALTLEEGRQRLHELAASFGKLTKPSRSLLDRAQSVGPYRKGGLVLVPEIDAVAAAERIEEAEREKEALLEEIEDLGIILLAQERLAEPTPVERLIPIEQLAREFGREHLLAE